MFYLIFHQFPFNYLIYLNGFVGNSLRPYNQAHTVRVLVCHIWKKESSIGIFSALTFFFLYCRYYRELRNRLIQRVLEITTVSLQTLIVCDESLNIADNEKILSAVHSYIKDSEQCSV